MIGFGRQMDATKTNWTLLGATAWPRSPLGVAKMVSRSDVNQPARKLLVFYLILGHYGNTVEALRELISVPPKNRARAASLRES